jgi:type 1 glutamine amidotransferase
MNRNWIFSLAVCMAAYVIGVEAAAPLDVLVVTGKHKYDEAAFGAMFDSFSGMNVTIKNMGTDPSALFEKIDGFPYDAIVLYNFHQTLPEPMRENFKALLDNGVGLTVMHHALIGFEDWMEYENIIGATYVKTEQTRGDAFYPKPTWKHGVDMKIDVVDPGHPITTGVGSFMIHDETYKGWVYHAGNHLLLATDNELSNRQIAWTREQNGCRIFVIQLGHDAQAFGHEKYRTLIRQGIRWTADQ